MPRGAALHCLHTGRGNRWVLSDGSDVSSQTARDVCSDPHVTGVGDSLFGVELSQTFRYVD
jgi:hypothetical protein